MKRRLEPQMAQMTQMRPSARLSICDICVICGFFLLTAGAPGRASAAAGLSTKMGDLRVENLAPGRSVDLVAEGAGAYEVTNRGDAAASIAVEPLVPTSETLLEGYEPLPDPSWVRVEPSTHVAPAGTTVSSRIVLALPQDGGLAGRKFQANLWARTTGETVGVGVLSRLRLEFAPGTLHLEDLGGRLRVVNGGAKKVRAELRAEGADPAPGGSSPAGAGAVRLDKSAARPAAGGSAEVGYAWTGAPSGKLRAVRIVARVDGRDVASCWIYERQSQ